MESVGLEGAKNAVVSGDAQRNVADGARAHVEFSPKGPAKVTMRIGRGCRVSCMLVSASGSPFELSSTVGAGSSLSCASIWLSGGAGRFISRLEGEAASSGDVHVFIARGSDRVDVESTLVHSAPRTKGDIHVRGVAMDGSRAELEGMIRIDGSGSGA